MLSDSYNKITIWNLKKDIMALWLCNGLLSWTVSCNAHVDYNLLVIWFSFGGCIRDGQGHIMAVLFFLLSFFLEIQGHIHPPFCILNDSTIFSWSI